MPRSAGGERVFRYSVFWSLVSAMAFSSITLALLGLIFAEKVFLPEASRPLFVLYWMTFVFAIAAWIGWFFYRARRRPCNWLVRIHAAGVRVKFRSYLNDHFPEQDLVVADIPFSAISWVRKVRERLVAPDPSEAGMDRNSFHTCLDLKLNSPGAASLRQALLAERKREAPRSKVQQLTHALFLARKAKASPTEIAQIRENIKAEKRKTPNGNGKSRTTHHHYPVRMREAEILRIEWNGIRPGIGEALGILSQKLRVEPECSVPGERWTHLKGKDLEDRILDLAERGKIFEAASLARQRYGYSLTESKIFVDELLRR